MPLPDFEALANRVRKMQRHYARWARKQGIYCYRIYDADIPEFPLAIDVYGDALHVAEYQRKHTLSDEEYLAWQRGCQEVLESVTGTENLFFKHRQQQKGKDQYEKYDSRQAERIVQEGGLNFIVNLSDYLDTGLFLDHRTTRDRVRQEAAGKRVLNLFCYTGSFTAYAAEGGASSSLSIDLSNTYLNWAQRNLELNELQSPKHEFLQADVKQWLRNAESGQFDLIVIDPPTFSNSKRMLDVLDVQRDHAAMLHDCIRCCRPGAQIYFSTNYRRFKFDHEAFPGLQIHDISAQTVPPDFRNKRIHQCYLITTS